METRPRSRSRSRSRPRSRPRHRSAALSGSPGSPGRRLLQPLLRGEQVSFQGKNSDSLLKNPDFLVETPDFLVENVDFIIKKQHGRAKDNVGQWQGLLSVGDLTTRHSLLWIRDLLEELERARRRQEVMIILHEAQGPWPNHISIHFGHPKVNMRFFATFSPQSGAFWVIWLTSWCFF